MKVLLSSTTWLVLLLLIGAAQAQDTSQQENPPMEKVTGIGGFFFKAKDPDKLAQWYHEHLGVSPVPKSYQQEPWSQQAGETAFAPFPTNSNYFGSKKQMWMINFRVRNLKLMVSQLQAKGIEVEVDPKEYPNGSFANLTDPEGNPIQLWQPKRPKASKQ